MADVLKGDPFREPLLDVSTVVNSIELSNIKGVVSSEGHSSDEYVNYINIAPDDEGDIKVRSIRCAPSGVTWNEMIKLDSSYWVEVTIRFDE